MTTTLTRTVAIVGRPNVGKSALFNRIAGRRLSIVHEESGVTRDRVRVEASWGEERFDLVDTGGLGQVDRAERKDVIESGIHQQIEAAIEDASVLVFVVDITAGILPLDRQVAENLHASGRPVFLAANKADHPGLDSSVSEFSGLGFPVYPVSALHNRGLDALLRHVVEQLPLTENVSLSDPLRVTIAGKPNVGKSSYINRLLRSDRVIVSDVPGTTRDSIDIPFTMGKGPQARHYLLTDTAGMRRKRKAKDAVEKFSIMRAEKSIENADVVVHVIDAQAGPGAQDKKIAALIAEHRKGAILLVNKWDLSEVTQRQYTKALRAALPFMGHVPFIYASAETGYNMRRSVEAIDHVGAQVSTTLSTGILNRALQDAVRRVQPPLVRGKRMKLFYATQFGTRPVRIKLFVNYKTCVTASYRQYLVNSLYKAFGLEGAPIVFSVTPRKPKKAP